MSSGSDFDAENIESSAYRPTGGGEKEGTCKVSEVDGGGGTKEGSDKSEDGRAGERSGEEKRGIGRRKSNSSDDDWEDAMMEQKEEVTQQQPQKEVGGLTKGLTGFLQRCLSSSRKDRQFYENLTLEEKRTYYKHKEFITLDDIATWSSKKQSPGSYKKKPHPSHRYKPFPLLDSKVSLWQGDITHLEIGAIVNAANSSLLGGGGVDGAIHRAAGRSLYDECRTFNGCRTGQTKLTSGHALPAKYVLHTVGPFNGSSSDLKSCYRTCLELVQRHNITSVAFCCIATGIYGYPNDDAADIAISIVREWLETNAEKVKRIIFCVFLERDLMIYRRKLCHYFPAECDEEDDEKQEEVIEENRSKKESEMSGETNVPVIIPGLVHSVTEPARGMSASRISVKAQGKEEKDALCIAGKEEEHQKKRCKKENQKLDEKMEASDEKMEASDEKMEAPDERSTDNRNENMESCTDKTNSS